MKFEKEKFEANNEMDEMILALGEAIRKSESRPSLLDVEKVMQIQKDYHLLSRMAEENDAQVTWGLHSPFVSMGHITLEAEDLVFTDSKTLAEVISRETAENSV